MNNVLSKGTTRYLDLPAGYFGIVLGIIGADFGWCSAAVAMFIVGAVAQMSYAAWLSLEPAILHRMRSQGEMPNQMRLSLRIQLAPALVACSAWLRMNNGQADILAKMLFGYGMLQMLFMIRLLPWYLKNPFNIAFWSFSFGLSVFANTALHLGHESSGGILPVLAMPLFVFGNVLIGLLLARTVLLFLQGKLLKYSLVNQAFIGNCPPALT